MIKKTDKIVIIGANGQLGKDLVNVLHKFNPVCLNHSEADVSDFNSIRKDLNEIKPSYIINTSAYHRTDYCELYPELAFTVNSLGALNLAKVSEELNSILIHISTDYVFDGKKNKPYVESDPVMPLNIYACSKVAGEFNIINNTSKYYIIRTSGLYGESICRAKGENFVTKMLKLSETRKELKIVSDEYLTPTWTYSLSLQILELLEKLPEFGIIHATDEGYCSWFEFTKEIFSITGILIDIVPCKSIDFPSNLKRPLYSVLENKKLNEYNINIMKDWKLSLKEYLNLIGR